MAANEDKVGIDLAGKHVLVTGGSMGIGYAAAEICLAAGASVTICARNASGVSKALEALHAGHGSQRIMGEVGDISSQADVERLFSVLIERFGRIDGVIHCAGIYGPIGKITEIEPGAWLEVLRVNLFGTFLVAREACRIMREQGGGRIVLLSGGGAATPFPNYTGYACSKVAVVRFAETIAIEMASYGIEINCVAPGFVATRLHDETLAAGTQAGNEFHEKTQELLASGAVPASVGGRTAAFLLSDAAKGITGKFIAAPYDAWSDFPSRLDELKTSDIFTLRRVTQ